MKISAKALSLFTILSAAVITGCQTQSNTIVFTTPAPTVMFNSANQTALVNVITQDMRNSREVAVYGSEGKINRLNAVPDVSQLFQQAMQQNLNSKGFGIVQGAGNVNVIVNIRKFFADVEQGNLRYKITANTDIEIVVQGAKGNVSKNFTRSRSYEGVFSAANPEIQKMLNQVYTDTILAIYNDNGITNAIHQVK